jgi:hypothetical protein
MATGKPDPGKKPKVPDYQSDGDGDASPMTTPDVPRPSVGLGSARGGQNSPRPTFKAQEKSTRPVVSGGVRSTTGWVRGEDTAMDPTIP